MSRRDILSPAGLQLGPNALIFWSSQSLQPLRACVVLRSFRVISTDFSGQLNLSVTFSRHRTYSTRPRCNAQENPCISKPHWFRTFPVLASWYFPALHTTLWRVLQDHSPLSCRPTYIRSVMPIRQLTLFFLPHKELYSLSIILNFPHSIPHPPKKL